VPDLWLRAQEFREREAVGIVRLHPDGQRLGAAQDEERVERTENRALGVLHEPEPLDVVVAHGDDDAADAVAVTVEYFVVLGDQIGAKLDRP
jgi:hypothetical protein